MYHVVHQFMILLCLVVIPCHTIVNGQALNTTTSNSSDPPSTFPSDVPSDTPSTAPSIESVVAVNVTENIVGGTLALIGEFPFYAYPVNQDVYCGATLIHEDIILTSANCFCDTFDDGVYIGGTYRDGTIDVIDIQPYAYCQPHPDFDAVTIQNNIMVLKLLCPSTAEVVSLNYDSTIPFVDEVVTSIGFGATEFGNSATLQYELRKVENKIFSDEICDASIPIAAGDYIPDLNICAGDGVEGIEKCTANGDFGGPLLTAENIQVGIASYGNCAFTAYTEVAAYKSFIQKFICDYADNQPEYCVTPSILAAPTCPVTPFPTPYPTPFPTPSPPTDNCSYPGKGKGEGKGDGKGSMMSGKKCKKGMKTPKEPKTPKAGDGKMSMGEMKMMGMKYKTRK